MEFIKLLKAGSIISGINWSIYLIHEWVHFAMNNPPEVVTEGNPVFLGLIAQSLASLSLIGFGILYKSRTANDADGSKTIPKPRLTAPPTNFSKPTELPVTETAKPQNAVSQTTPPVTPRIEPGFASPKPVIEPVAMSPAPKVAKPLSAESPKSDHRLLILLLLIVGMIASAIYFIKQKPADEPEAIVKTPTAEEKPSDPQPQAQPQPASKPNLVASEPINKRWLGKWLDTNNQITISGEALVITNLETKTDISFKWLGTEPTENPQEPIFYYAKTINKSELVNAYEKYVGSVANPNEEQRNQFEQVKKMVEGLSEGSYRMIRLKMSWSSSVYRSFIFDQNNVYRLDFDPQERLTAIVRYRKANE